MEYILEGVFLTARPIVKGLIIYGVFVAVMLVIGQRERLENRRWFFPEFILGIYVVCVLSITGLLGGIWDFEGNNLGGFNLEFMTKESPKLMVLNFIMFVPLGILLPMTFFRSGAQLTKTVVTGFMFSCCIEFAQLMFVGRFADIDDVVFNTGGCLAGAIIFLVADAFGSPVAVSLLGILWSLGYKTISPGDIVLATFGLRDALYQAECIYTEICGVLIGIVCFLYSASKKSIPGVALALTAIAVAIYEAYIKGVI